MEQQLAACERLLKCLQLAIGICKYMCMCAFVCVFYLCIRRYQFDALSFDLQQHLQFQQLLK